MNKKIFLDFGNKKVPIEAHVARGLGRISGLMFSRKEKARILLFEFSMPVKLSIHSLFVFFPFIAIWIDSDGKISEIRKVMPFSFHVCPKKHFLSFIEVPINEKNKNIVVDIEKFK